VFKEDQPETEGGKGKGGAGGADGSKDGKKGAEAAKKVSGKDECAGNETPIASQLQVALTSIKEFLEKAHAEEGGQGKLSCRVMDKLEGVLNGAFGISDKDEAEEKAPKSKRWRAARERVVKADDNYTSKDKKRQLAAAHAKKQREEVEKADKAEAEAIREFEEAGKERKEAQTALQEIQAEPEEQEEVKDKLSDKDDLVGTPIGVDDLPMVETTDHAVPGGTVPGGKGMGKAPSRSLQQQGPYSKTNDVTQGYTLEQQQDFGEEVARRWRELQEAQREFQEAHNEEIAKRRRTMQPTEEQLETAKREAEAKAVELAKAAQLAAEGAEAARQDAEAKAKAAADAAKAAEAERTAKKEAEVKAKAAEAAAKDAEREREELDKEGRHR